MNAPNGEGSAAEVGETCAACGRAIAGGPDAWHTENGGEMCDAEASDLTFHRPRPRPTPAGMTAEKLRQVADYITSADSLVEKYLRAAKESGHDVPDDVFEFVSGKAMQHDLRAWADAIEAEQ